MEISASEVLPGHLYVVGTPIGNLGDLSQRTILTLKTVDLIACEDTRVTKKLLTKLDITRPTLSYREENEKLQTPALLKELQAGKSIALVSDAGTPTLSDPGFRIVRACRLAAIPVVPIPGPSAFLSALCASGLPTNSFLFIGFLPPKTAARIRFFEKYQDFEYTLILYESCHRIDKFLDDLLKTLGPGRTICLAREITKRHETFLVGSAQSVYDQLQNSSKKGEFVVLIAPKDFAL